MTPEEAENEGMDSTRCNPNGSHEWCYCCAAVLRQDTRNKALEEAAKVADEWWINSSEHQDCKENECDICLVRDLAKTIRALKEKK